MLKSLEPDLVRKHLRPSPQETFGPSADISLQDNLEIEVINELKGESLAFLINLDWLDFTSKCLLENKLPLIKDNLITRGMARLESAQENLRNIGLLLQKLSAIEDISPVVVSLTRKRFLENGSNATQLEIAKTFFYDAADIKTRSDNGSYTLKVISETRRPDGFDRSC